MPLSPVATTAGRAAGAAPGETPEAIDETIDETLRVLHDYEIPLGVWVTVGVDLWRDYQQIVREGRGAGWVQDEMLFSGAVYLSPRLSQPCLDGLLQTLRARPGYKVQCNHVDG